jgi:hypothetical protein
MAYEDVKLDFENNGQLTLDDISFGPPEEIVPTAAVETPAPTLPSAPVAPAAAEEKKPEEEALTLDEISFEGSPEEVQEAKATVDGDLKLAAIRAILAKKLERNNLETETDLATLTEEQLVDFEEEVDKNILDSRYESVKGTDPRVGVILNYLEDGGDPKRIAKLFQEREVIDNIDITDAEGQTALIKSYLKNVKNLSEAEVIKRVDRLEAAGLLEEEAKDIQVEYNAHNETKVANELERQKTEALKIEQNENRKKIIFDKALRDNAVPLKLQNDLKKVAFAEGLLPDGSKIKIMDYKIMEMQTNPESFYKLSLFLADPGAYDAMIMQNTKNKEVTAEMKKGFNVEVKAKSGTEKTNIVNPGPKRKVEFNF